MILIRIPNDPDAAALPLSTAYRDTLRPLCELIKKKDTKLPPEVERKRKTIEKLCQKLRADDEVGGGGGGGGGSGSSRAMDGLRKWAFPLCAFAGVCYWGYHHKLSLPRDPVTASSGDISMAREARLKRFKES